MGLVELHVFALFAPLILGGAAGGGPIGLAVGIIATAIIALFGIFGGGDRALKDAVTSLARQVADITDKLTRFAWHIARALGKLLQAVGGLWVRVIDPILNRIAKLAAKINSILDRVLKPYLDFLKRVRAIIDYYYNTVFRPIIVQIERIRRITSILAALHVPGARALDRRLLRLEGKILAPIRYLYGKVNETGGWINLILTPALIFRQAVFLNSAAAHQGGLTRLWWNSQSEPLTDAQRAELRRKVEPPPFESSYAEARAAALQGSGTLGADIAAAKVEAEQLLFR